jgi:hypothetical protein
MTGFERTGAGCQTAERIDGDDPRWDLSALRVAYARWACSDAPVQVGDPGRRVRADRCEARVRRSAGAANRSEMMDTRRREPSA